MDKIKHLLERAKDLMGKGNNEDAQKLLEAILQQNPLHQVTWTWYIQSITDPVQRLNAAERWVKADPKNPFAQTALAYCQRVYIPLLQKNLAEERSAREKDRQSFEVKKLQFTQQFTAIRKEMLGTQQASTRKYATSISGLVLAIIAVGLIAVVAAVGAVGTFARNKQLDSQNAQLQSDYASLESQYEQLSSLAILPPYIYVHGRDITIAFIKTNNEIEYWEVPFDTLEYELELGNYTRYYAADSSTLLSLPTTDGRTFYVEDMTLFVDAQPFEQVISDLYNQAGNNDAFIREVWNIVTQLSVYSEEIGEKPRYPLETFLAGGGDCEDTAILFASMILAAPVNWQVQLVFMDADYPTNPQSINHVIVYIDTGQSTYLIETTSDTVMQPYLSGVTGWYFDAGE